MIAERDRGAGRASALAWLFYVRSPGIPERLAAAIEPLYTLSLNKFYLDEIFAWLIVAPLRGAGVAVELVRSRGHRSDCRWRRRWCRVRAEPACRVSLHNGLVSSYALVMLAGVVVCVLVVLKICL